VCAHSQLQRPEKPREKPQGCARHSKVEGGRGIAGGQQGEGGNRDAKVSGDTGLGSASLRKENLRLDRAYPREPLQLD